MQYYKPNDKRPRVIALVAFVAYAVVLALSFVLVEFDLAKADDKNEDTIFIDLTEPAPEPPPKPVVRVATEPRVHDKVAAEELTEQVAGTDEVTQTPNPKALFDMNKGGVDEPDNVGNSRAAEGEDRASGTGQGLNPDGLAQLDQGLQGRGLVGALPIPSHPGDNLTGKIVVRVVVDSRGVVTNATYEAKGSTSSDTKLVEAALSAARKTRFTESRAVVEGGLITYLFTLSS